MVRGQENMTYEKVARSVQLERKATALLASIDVMKPSSPWIRGNPHELNHKKF